MSWLLPSVPSALQAWHYKKHRLVYHQQWREENRERLRKYWREHYKMNRAKRRAYLNRKQREYRAKRAA